MLVILNGAPKGGSTWLVQIVTSTGFFNPIPEKYQDRSWSNPSIKEEYLEDFLREVDYKKENYYCKQHWFNDDKYKALMEDKNIKIVNIVRDIKDVLVSRYFHDLRLGAISNDMDFEEYYWSGTGKKKITQYIEYQTFWHSGEDQPFLCGYRRLHEDFIGQAEELFNYLGFHDLNVSDLGMIQKKTSFDNKKRTGNGQFFRKGVVGDWKSHLSNEIVNDLHQLTSKTKYLELQQKMSCEFRLDLVDPLPTAN